MIARRRPEDKTMSARAFAKRRHRSRSLLAISDERRRSSSQADLLVVCGSVLLRFLFNAPVEWADDVARGLMVGRASLAPPARWPAARTSRGIFSSIGCLLDQAADDSVGARWWL